MTVPMLVKVSFKNNSGQPRDTVVGDFSYLMVDTTPANLNAVAAKVNAFYNGPNVSHPLAWHISPGVSRAGGDMMIDFYDLTGKLAGGPHGSPIFSVPSQLGPFSTTKAMPAQVCVAVSWNAWGVNPAPIVIGAADANIPTQDEAVDEGAPAVHAGFDHPRARSQGRTFIGPLSTDPVIGDGNANGHVTPDFRADLAFAANLLCKSTNTNKLQVWSRRDANMKEVLGGWIDDSFDVIRARKIRPAIRTAFTNA